MIYGNHWEFMTKNQSYFWLAIFAFGTIAFTLVQDKIRPNYSGQNDVINYLLGIAPNYFAALALSAFFVVMIFHINEGAKKPATSPWFTNYAHHTAAAISLTGLSLWEFAQNYSSRGHADWHDIIWTLGGTSTFYLIWYIVKPKSQDNKK